MIRIIPEKYQRYIQYFSVFLLCTSTIILVGLQIHPWGWYLLFLSVAFLFFCKKEFAQDFLLLHISIAILGLTEINTDIDISHVISMSTTLGFAVAIPYFISRFIYKRNTIKFRFHHGRNWYSTEIFYIFLTLSIAYFLLPFYLQNTHAYQNWSVQPGIGNIITLFLGTNALGAWDEFFFICTALAIFRKHFSFKQANIFQGILFTSFLYELGFRGWGFIMIFIFALLQGYIYKRTESIFYVLTIHLSLDLVLFLAIIHAHHPSWMPIFPLAH